MIYCASGKGKKRITTMTSGYKSVVENELKWRERQNVTKHETKRLRYQLGRKWNQENHTIVMRYKGILNKFPSQNSTHNVIAH